MSAPSPEGFDWADTLVNLLLVVFGWWLGGLGKTWKDRLELVKARIDVVEKTAKTYAEQVRRHQRGDWTSHEQSLDLIAEAIATLSEAHQILSAHFEGHVQLDFNRAVYSFKNDLTGDEPLIANVGDRKRTSELYHISEAQVCLTTFIDQFRDDCVQGQIKPCRPQSF